MKNILVIEDNDHLRFLLCKFLRDNHFHVIEAENAPVGVILAQEQYPDLIIYDLDIPAQYDYPLLEELQEDSNTREIPLILLISKAEKFYLQQSRPLLANLWLKKPVSFGSLLSAIAIQLNQPVEKSGLS